MRVLRWILSFVVLMLLFALALQNIENATLRFYGGFAWQLPFVVWLLLAFSAGAAFGLLTVFIRISRLRREVLKLKRELRGRQQSANQPPSPQNILDAL